MQKLMELNPSANDIVPKVSDAERAALAEKLAKRQPALGIELARIIERMQAGHCVDLEDAKVLHHQLEKLGL